MPTYGKKLAGQRGAQAYQDAAGEAAQLNQQSVAMGPVLRSGFNMNRRNNIRGLAQNNTLMSHRIRMDDQDRQFRNEQARREDIRYWTEHAAKERTGRYNQDLTERKFQASQDAQNFSQELQAFNTNRGMFESDREFARSQKVDKSNRKNQRRTADRLDNQQEFKQGMDKYNAERKNYEWDKTQQQDAFGREADLLTQFEPDSVKKAMKKNDPSKLVPRKEPMDNFDFADLVIGKLGTGNYNVAGLVDEDGNYNASLMGVTAHIRKYTESGMGLDEAFQTFMEQDGGDSFLTSMENDTIANLSAGLDKDEPNAQVQAQIKSLQERQGLRAARMGYGGGGSQGLTPRGPADSVTMQGNSMGGVSYVGNYDEPKAEAAPATPKMPQEEVNQGLAGLAELAKDPKRKADADKLAAHLKSMGVEVPESKTEKAPAKTKKKKPKSAGLKPPEMPKSDTAKPKPKKKKGKGPISKGLAKGLADATKTPSKTAWRDGFKKRIKGIDKQRMNIVDNDLYSNDPKKRKAAEKIKAELEGLYKTDEDA